MSKTDRDECERAFEAWRVNGTARRRELHAFRAGYRAALEREEGDQRLEAAETALDGLLMWCRDQPYIRGFNGIPQELTSSVKKRSKAALLRWRALRAAAIRELGK